MKILKIASLSLGLALQISSVQAAAKKPACVRSVVFVTNETPEAQAAFETSVHLLNTPGLDVVANRENDDGSRLVLVDTEFSWQKRLLGTLRSLPGVIVECENTAGPSPRITGGN